MKYILLLLALVGCDAAHEQATRKSWLAIEAQALTDNLFYFKDDATNICYAGLSVGFASGTLATVPCYPEVEARATHFTSPPK